MRKLPAVNAPCGSREHCRIGPPGFLAESYEATEPGIVSCFTLRLFVFFCVILSSLFSYTFDYSFSVLMLLVGSFDL